MRIDLPRPLLVRLLILAVLVLVPAMAWLSLSSLDRFEKGLAPEFERKAVAVGRDLGDDLERAVGYGIPLDKLVGVEDYLAPALEANGELRYVAVADLLGKVLYIRGADPGDLEPHYRSTDYDAAGPGDGIGGLSASIGGYVDVAVPLMVKGARVGELHVGMDAGYLRHRFGEMLTDVAVLMVVALFLTAEILLFVVVVNISGPLDQAGRVFERVARGDFGRLCWVGSEDEVGRFTERVNAAIRAADDLFRRLMAYIDEVKAAHFDPNVVEQAALIEARVKFLFRFSAVGAPEAEFERHGIDVRLALFLFVFAEELSRPFLPLFIRTLPMPPAWLSPEMAMAVPIAVFMAFIALASPWAGAISERWGSRRVFLLGLVPAVLGFIGTGLADSVVEVVVWRAATGFGYALVTMASQSYIARSIRHRKGRTQGLGLFVGAVLTASVCGMALGGVLVDHIGFSNVFFTAAGFALVSGILANRLPDPVAERREVATPRPAELIELLRNWRFAALMVFAAMPAKLALTGVVFFLVPLSMASQGFGFGDIARALMVYAVTVVVLAPLVSRLADRGGWRAGLVALGGLIGGLGMLAPALGPGLAPLLLALLCLGISQGLAASTQLAVVPDICWIEWRTLGQTSVLAQVRLLERVGSVAGPLLAAMLVPFVGYNGAIAAIGGLVLVFALVFAGCAAAFGTGPHLSSEEAR